MVLPGTDRRDLLRFSANHFRADETTKHWYFWCAEHAFLQVRIELVLVHRFKHRTKMYEMDLEVGRAVGDANMHKDNIKLTWGKVTERTKHK